jgi:purine-binding chemotaxis protein CheW
VGANENDKKYLIFTLGTEEYGMPIRKIREIIGYVPVIPFARPAGLIKGVIRVQGRSIPVLDLRQDVYGQGLQTTRQTCIILVDLLLEGMTVLTGVIVDSVSSVLGSADNMPERAIRSGYPENISVSWGSAADRTCSVFISR